MTTNKQTKMTKRNINRWFNHREKQTQQQLKRPDRQNRFLFRSFFFDKNFTQDIYNHHHHQKEIQFRLF